MLKNTSVLIRWVVGLGLIAYLLTLIDFKSFLGVLSKGRLELVFLAVLVVLLDRVWMGSKWRILLKAQGIRVSYFECVRSYFVASFVGVALPTSVGSDLVRLMSLSVEEGERGKVAASIVVEKLLAMLAMLTLVCLCIFLLAMTSTVPLWRYFFMATGVLTLLLLLFLFSLKFFPLEKLKQREGRFFKMIVKVVLAYQQFRFYKKSMLIFFAVTFLEQMVPFVFNYILALAFQLPFNFLGYFAVVPIIYLVARIPISVDAIGVLEGLFVLLFPLVGLSKTDSLLLALSGRAATTIGHLFGGIFYFLQKRR